MINFCLWVFLIISLNVKTLDHSSIYLFNNCVFETVDFKRLLINIFCVKLFSNRKY